MARLDRVNSSIPVDARMYCDRFDTSGSESALEATRVHVEMRMSRPGWNARFLTFLKQDGIVLVSQMGISQGTYPGIQANADSHWSSERRFYAANEETNPPIGGCISDRLAVPVQAG